MATERRSSFGASSIHSGRRLSSSSIQLPPLPPSTGSLTLGSAIPPPTVAPSAPIPPPKDPSLKPMPVTPQRKPVLRQKSPLSNEPYFASPASSMPGTFPTTPLAGSPATGMSPAQFSTTVSATPSSLSTNSKSPKRPSSVRNLLSFKALRRSSEHGSPASQGFRPASSSAESTLSSPQPSLNKKRSGSFWRRKSSLGMTFGKEGETGDKSGSPGLSGETVLEEENPGRSPTPAPGSDFPTVRKRKSGTFWRRKSSLGMASAFGANGDPEIRGNGTTNGVTSSGSNVINGKQNGVSGEQNGMNSDYDGRTSMAEQENEKPLPDIAIASTRSWSPPPQLPELIGGGGGLGGEDLFKDIQ